MIRNYTLISITFIVILILITGSYLIAQRITNAKPDFDAGMAAYKRGHYPVALYDFESRAERGDIVAQFRLAYMLQHGRGVKKTKSGEVSKWYKSAASQGYPPAQNNLAVLYVRRAEAAADKSLFLANLEIAEKWFKMAAEQDYAPAQFNLYIIQVDKPVEWLTKAAEGGYAPAQSELGHLYYYGDGIVKNLEKATKWLKEAAAQDYPDAQNLLGMCYENGNGVKQNDDEAFKWYEKAAKQGNAAAQFNLGLCYMFGRGVAKNPKEIFTYFFKAAEQGNIEAQNNLAVLYSEGVGVPKSPEMSSRWYHLAAQQGQALAQSNIGVKFEKGQSGIPQDDAEAYFWYNLACKDKAALDRASDKDRTAKITEARERVKKVLKPDQIDEIEERIQNWKPKYLEGAGTGFYVDKHLILTNAHVVIDEDTGKALDEFRIPYRRVDLIAWDQDVDLALLYDQRENTDAATFRKAPVKFGEKVALFGYPRSNRLSYEGNIVQGTVSGTLYIIDDSQFRNRFQHTAPMQRGNSGGPVFDNTGNVIGVCSDLLNDYELVYYTEPSIGGNPIPQIFNLAQNINFAIKSNVVKDFLSDKIHDYEGGAPAKMYKLKASTEEEIKEGFERTILPLSEKLTTDLSLKELFTKAKNFTVPVLAFKNKTEQPSEVEEVGIEGLQQ